MKKIMVAASLGVVAISLFVSGYIGYSDWTSGIATYEQMASKELSRLVLTLPEQPQDYAAFLKSNAPQDYAAIVDSRQNLLAISREMDVIRPGEEVALALERGFGFSVRKSLQDGQFYYCAAMLCPQQQDNIVVFLAMASGKWSYLSHKAWIVFAVCAAGQAAWLLIIYLYYKKKLARPLQRLNQAVQKAADKNSGKEIFLQGYHGEIAELVRSFQHMNRILADNMDELGEQNGQLHAMLDSLTEAVVAVDLHSRILLTNPAAHAMLGISPDCNGKMLLETVHSEALGQLLDEVRKSRMAAMEEMKLRMDSDQLLRVQISPIISAAGKSIGEMIVAEDVTQMRRLEHMRSEFASNVSHELKTPLTSIIGFVDALKEGALKDEKVARRFIDIIGKESDRLYRLIQDILLLSSIESSSADANLQPVDLSELAGQVYDLLASSAAKKGLSFSVVAADDLPRFFCNRDRIFQLWLNLCDNAVKYTESGQVRASVEYRADQKEFCFIVSDTGIGIPKEAQERIFERFYRVDKGRSRTMGGTGLGLSIVKHIVLLYGGTIKVDSQPTKGSTFEVRLAHYGGATGLPEDG